LESGGPLLLELCVLHELLSLALELKRLVIAALLVQLLSLEHGLFGLADVLLGCAVVLFGLLGEPLALTFAEGRMRGGSGVEGDCGVRSAAHGNWHGCGGCEWYHWNWCGGGWEHHWLYAW
jgi:hypothetical protein